ncbi:MAG TPA: hypothetical protein VFZ09_24330 [Archangium sp.]|uniref:hypothetical protein n=1 Tax=Archangium sp. TaxID=1872627 RepID=UPI002E3376DD|nr:hypothetical protein [Archangium sp.]HEX5749378.1 hypothetical protein [Archangium sp.]
MVKSRVPPSRGSAVGSGAGSLLLALMALVLLGVWARDRPGARHGDLGAAVPGHDARGLQKSRDFSGMDYGAVRAQMIADARAALAYYGETLNIRRPGLEGRVKVRRVRLIYEGGALKPRDERIMREALHATKATVPGVEVLFR